MKENDTQKTEILILGAGLAGLAAGLRLIEQGKGVIIIEKEHSVGGMCRSFKFKGFTFDLGGHRFLPHNKDTADFVNALFDSQDLVVIDRKSRIYLKKRFLLYPPEFSDILKNLGLMTCFRAFLDSAYSRVNHLIFKKPEISLRDWLINRFGYTLYDIYFGQYSLKLWGRSPLYISRDWAPQRISVPNIAAAIRSLFLEDNKPIKTYATKFLYPNGGIGEIPKRMADKFIELGGEILLGNVVTKVKLISDGFLIETLTKEGKKRTVSSSQIISTIPLNEFINSISPQPPQEVLDAAKNLRFRSVRFLNLLLDIPGVSENTWLYIPEREFVFFRIQEAANWHPNNSPAGKTALTLEIACDKNGRLWQMDDDKLLEVCVNDLARMKIDIKANLIDYFSTFAEHAYPIYSLSYRKHLQKIYNYILRQKNLIVCGRQGLFRYLNMDAAMENGFEVAASLCNGRVDFQLPKEDKDYLEANLYLKNDG